MTIEHGLAVSARGVGIEKKICWRVTRRCNLRCIHCLAGHANMERPDLPFEKLILAADVVVAAGVTRVTWTGGEPTLNPQLRDLVVRLQERNVASVITTHGLNIPHSLLQGIDSKVVRFRISFDGLENTHNRIRRLKGFHRALSTVDRLVQDGYTVEANISVLADNVDEIPELVDLLSSHGVSRIVLLTLMMRESAIDNSLSGPSKAQMAQMRQRLDTLACEASRKVALNDYGQPEDRYIVLESDGEVLLCSNSNDESFGFITEQLGMRFLSTALAAQTLAHRRLSNGGPHL